MTLPTFKYHPDPIASGSIRPSPDPCRCCKKPRGFIYTGPAYSEDDLDDALCPWCIADGSAHKKFDAEFTDAAAFPDDSDPDAIDIILTRTPGFATWQGIEWPTCCADLMAFLEPVGIDEIRTKKFYTLEGLLMTHIVHDLGISGGAATRLLQSLHKDRGPTAYAFKCQTCDNLTAKIDSP